MEQLKQIEEIITKELRLTEIYESHQRIKASNQLLIWHLEKQREMLNKLRTRFLEAGMFSPSNVLTKEVNDLSEQIEELKKI
jgi:hypothetical protein